MAKQIQLSAFVMNCVGHQCSGLWRHPRDRSHEYKTLSYWTDLAKTLEQGLFDGIFIADVLGINDVYGNSPESAIRAGMQVPINDPLMLIPAMASVTEHLGFGVTCSLTYEGPYTFARRMSTLDHLTNGRIAWNIVTSFLDSAARASGLSKQTDHDIRYDIAEEYMSVVYELWERCWEDDAVVRDAERAVFTDPGKVHRLQHEGQFFKLDGVHLCEPSPQRTPVLYQAGTSAKGAVFAARHAECIFVNGPSVDVVALYVKRTRDEIARQGRDPASVSIISMLTVITGPTDEEAEEKFRDYSRYANREGAFVVLSGWSGVDYAKMSPEDAVKHVRTESMQTGVDRFTKANPDKVWTVGEMADFTSIGGAGPVLVGSPAKIVDEMQARIAATGVDGFNLAYTVMPETFTDFVELVVPEMQRRGIYKTQYSRGTLREKLFAQGPKLGAQHPASRSTVSSKTQIPAE
mgnify:CR=1 FL=1